VNIKNMVLAILLLFVSAGMVSALDCAYTLSPASVAPGTIITVNAPLSWDSRSLDYIWSVVDATTGTPVVVYAVDGVNPPVYNTNSLTFLAPNDGNYKIMLTVNDAVAQDPSFEATCLDTRCMAFSTSESFTCPMSDITFCEVDHETALPTTYTYTGAANAGTALQWLVDGSIVQEGLTTASVTFSPSWSTIFDFTDPPVTEGTGIQKGETHTITLIVYKAPFTKDGNGHYTGTLKWTCTATFISVAKPVAKITQ
jgi:hypothetical protein